MNSPETNEPDDEKGMRISRYLARCGIASRRKSEDLVLAGRVKVDGKVIHDLSTRVDVNISDVRLDGRPVGMTKRHLTLAYYKPYMVMVTRNDPQERRTVYDLLPRAFSNRKSQLVHVGRLDYKTTGLIILTTDGDLTNRLTHPSTKIEKEYFVVPEPRPNSEGLKKLREGVELDDGPTGPAVVEPINWEISRKQAYSVILRQGRYRQIRRMFEAIGCKVERLHRHRIGALTLTGLDLPPGKWQKLTPEMIEKLLLQEWESGGE